MNGHRDPASPAEGIADAAAPTVWTIGHSNRSAAAFVDVLRAHGIEGVADVRRFPGSRRHPQFGADALADALAGAGMHYVGIAELGGRRRVLSGPLQAGWRNESFRAYAAYTWTEEFALGLARLADLALAERTAMMCSEVLWWRCHRALVSDVLLHLGWRVLHIVNASPAAPHRYTAPAQIVDGELVYPQPA